MSSLLLFELVWFYFQKYYSEYLSKIDEKNVNNNITSLWHFFYGFLKFYGSEFDYTSYQISLENRWVLINKKAGSQKMNYMW